MAKLKWIKIQGFRSFGHEPQTLVFDSNLAVMWGGNSHGKTSLAEAFEFLLTGEICRCSMTASSQDEFADSLRNAHLPEAVPVFVAAGIQDAAGTIHVVRRTIREDYGRKHVCSSTLEVNGKPAGKDALATIGVLLGDPPLAAPVLLQHTLGYLFSAKPQERADYFKALLEVTDLEAMRSLVAEAGSCLEVALPGLEPLSSCVGIPSLGTGLHGVATSSSPVASLREEVRRLATSLLASAGQPTTGTDGELLERLRATLESNREKTFPLSGFTLPKGFPGLVVPASAWEALAAFLEVRKAMDAETARLVTLYKAVIDVAGECATPAPLDCPVCLTRNSITGERLAAIRKAVEDSSSYQTVRRKATAALGQIQSALDSIKAAVESWSPACVTWGRAKREKDGFQMGRMRALLAKDEAVFVDTWLRAVRRLLRTRQSLLRGLRELQDRLQGGPENLREASTLEALKNGISAFDEQRARGAAHVEACASAANLLLEPLKAVADARSNTVGWGEFLTLCARQATVESALLEQQARRAVRKAFDKALKDIDVGLSMILEAKFKTLSKEIAAWWEKLRPGEATFFESVCSRPKARRSIDFRVGLAPSSDRANVKLRNAIAVFSHSQLHCLGIAAFVAKAIRDGSGFIVLDDPIVSSDEDHRPHFMRTVIGDLVAQDVQVIVLTQDHKTWRDMNELYAHRNVDAFHLSRGPHGTVAVKESDSLAVMLTRAEPFVASDSLELRKMAAERLRDAAERFCKELLVKKRRESGDATALLADYDGKTLGDLLPKVNAHLTDPSHPGKLRTTEKNLNPGKHDDTPPSKGDLQCALGDLKWFKKHYL